MAKQIGLITGSDQQAYIEEMQNAVDQGWTILHCYAIPFTAVARGFVGARHFAVIQRDKPTTNN